jgi:fatty-acyl-CoA synthase
VVPAPVDHVGVQARLQPDRLAAVDLARDRRWSYAAFDRAIGSAAQVLLSRGCGAGERVASLARNRVELLLLHLACARIGAIYVPLNWRLSPPEVAALVADAAPRLLIGDGELARAGLQGISLDDVAAAIDAAEPLAPTPIDRSRPSLILYTSGTSGRPKGVLLSERNLDQTAINFGVQARVTHRSIFLNDSPMFHIIGLVTGVRAPLMQGGALLVSDGFEPGRTLARLGDPALGVTHYFAVPQMAAMLRAHADFDASLLRGLTGIFSGGAPHPAAAIRSWLDDGISIADGFGMSEAGTVTCMPLDPGLIGPRAGSTGLAMPGVAVRIVDAGGVGCPPGIAGELLIKGENVFSAYWRRPDETAAAFTSDGWFRTGDIAAMDEDGFVTLVDRKKDMYISGGENVFPAEIEAALAGHPGIAECAVVGVPDARWGEVGHVALVLLPGFEIGHAEITAHLEPLIARYKLPKAVTRLEALPRTASGKVQKALLRTLIATGRRPESSLISSVPQVEARIDQGRAQHAGGEALLEDDHAARAAARFFSPLIATQSPENSKETFVTSPKSLCASRS